MVNKAKILSALLLAFILLLSACTGKSSNTGETTADRDQNGGGSNDADEVVTISWWDTMTTEASVSALTKIIEEYEEAHPNVNIERTYVSFSDIKNKLLLGSVVDSGPDIVWIDSADHHAFAAAGILADITEEIKAWGQAEYYFDGPWSSTVYEGRNYGVPVGSNNLALYYNTDMFKEAGLTPPKNWEELKEAAAALTKDGVYGFAVSAVRTEEGTFQFLPFVYQAGSDVTNFNSEGTIEAASLYAYMASNGYMSQDVLTQKQSDIATQFAAGNVAMMVNGTWQIPFLNKEAKVNWDVVELPAYKQGGTILGGENWAITASSKHKDIAFDIIKFANEKDRLIEFLKTNGRLPSRGDLGIPFNMIILLSGLQELPEQLYEAAKLDGAGRLSQFRHITLPLMKPTILVLLMLGIIYTFKVFEIIFIMTAGGPIHASTVLPIYAYQVSFTTYEFSQGAAVSMIMVLILTILAVIYLRMMNKEEIDK